MPAWTSQPLPVPGHFYRADLEFEGIRHDGPSFLVLVYLDNPHAGDQTGRDEAANFAAAFSVFAHGVCWGDIGHCDVPSGPVSPFDRRPVHGLAPINITLDVSDALRRIAVGKDEVSVTLVVRRGRGQQEEAAERMFRFSRLTLVAYE